MRLHLAIIIALISTPCFAQMAPSSYTFTMTPDQANVMLNQLGKLDWATVNPLMQALIQQLQAQNNATQQPKSPQPDPPKD